jgi:hypothetical protein
MLLLARKEHVLYKLERGIQARESCLHNLRRKLQEVSEDDIYEHLTLAQHQRESTDLRDYEKRYSQQGYHHVAR